MNRFKILVFLALAIAFGCQNKDAAPIEKLPVSGKKLFNRIAPEKCGVDFNNRIVEDGELNYFKYTYLYNGGGVGISDINNDGLPDLYFTSTQGKDKLYLNKGNLTFEDISQSSGIDQFGGCKTGVSFVDINHDGWMDIYVCRAGWFKDPEKRKNLLFVNNQDNTFTETAGTYNISDTGRSIQSTFFDYDRDGDLDMYLSCHPEVFRQGIDEAVAKIKNPTKENTDKFFVQNDDGTFTESGKKVGIFNHGWGLGVVAADFNKDGWTDVYVSNDFQANDYYYLNNGDGTFTESLKKYFNHCSYFAMGVDFVDINNDQHLDLFVGEMLSEDNLRQKTNMAPMNPKVFKSLIDNGLHYQYMRNSFQLNNGNGHFSDIADYAGIAKTDWSWSSLFGDYDQDGDNDLLVVNGWLKDTQDKDFTKKASAAAKKNNNSLTFQETAAFMKSTPLKNYAFEYGGDLKFENVSEKWGFDLSGFSNGMAYGDLDGDGDLDIVVNNINSSAAVYQNTANSSDFIKIKFKGPIKNQAGLNNKITVFTDKGTQFKELQTVRGFQSSSEPIAHFGFASDTKIEQIEVEWFDGKRQLVSDFSKGKMIEVDYENAMENQTLPNAYKNSIFAKVSKNKGVEFTHKDPYFDDYELQVLLPHQLSQLGPALTAGDANGDGLEDVFVGGAKEQSSALWLQTAAGNFRNATPSAFRKDAKFEDVDALFFDADGDKDLDLYVVSGSYEFIDNPSLLEDRFYENEGNGNFIKKSIGTNPINVAGGTVSAADFDKDGDMDLFVGGRLIPGKYPVAPRSYLLENTPEGFKDVTAAKAPELTNPGMITSSVWTDFDSDGNVDLVIVGEWTDVLIYKNTGEKLSLVSEDMLSQKLSGWWNSVSTADLDGDGDQDLVLGNLGENYKYQATQDQPFEIYSGDIDHDQKRDIILGYYSGDELYPVRGLQCSSEQIPNLKRKFPTYEKFGKSNLHEVYGDVLKVALHYDATCFRSVILWNEGDEFSVTDLPVEAQIAPIQDCVILDFDKDNDLDILVAGNWFVSEVETPRADSGTGYLFRNDGNQKFSTVPVSESGFFTKKDTRKMALVSCGKDVPPMILVGNNNAELESFQLKE